MLGPLFFPIVTKKRDNKKVYLFSVLTICMVTVAGGEPRWYCWPIECDEIAVRTRNRYPHLRRKVNVNYLRTARTTATGDPLRGPIRAGSAPSSPARARGEAPEPGRSCATSSARLHGCSWSSPRCSRHTTSSRTPGRPWTSPSGSSSSTTASEQSGGLSKRPSWPSERDGSRC